MAQGRDLLVYVSSTGLPGGTKIPVDMQGDATVSPGKMTQIEIYKNGQNSAISDNGFSCKFEMGMISPLGAGQLLIMALQDSQAQSYFWLINSKTGGVQYDFSGYCAVENIAAPTNGDLKASVTLAAQGTVNRTTAP